MFTVELGFRRKIVREGEIFIIHRKIGMKIDRDRYENERTHTKVETQSFHRAGENKIKFGSCCCNTTYPAETCSKSRNRDRVTRCQTLSSRGIGSKGLFFSNS